MNILKFLQSQSNIRLVNVTLIAYFHEEGKGRTEHHYRLNNGTINEFGKDEYEILLVKKGSMDEKVTGLPLKFIPH